jgi:protein SCO1/2
VTTQEYKDCANEFFSVDPEGDFVEAIGRNFTAEQASKVIRDHVKDWTGPLDRKARKIE